MASLRSNHPCYGGREMTRKFGPLFEGGGKGKKKEIFLSQ